MSTKKAKARMEATYDAEIQEQTQKTDDGKNSGSGTMVASMTPKKTISQTSKKNASDPQENVPQRNALKSGKKSTPAKEVTFVDQQEQRQTALNSSKPEQKPTNQAKPQPPW